jgi:hypothetical protein
MSVGTDLSGKPVQGPWVSPQGANMPGDSVTAIGLVISVSGIDITGSAVLQLKSSSSLINVPCQDLHGNDPHRIPLAGTSAYATGQVSAVSGSGSTATLTVLLAKSQQTITCQANDCYASQSL